MAENTAPTPGPWTFDGRTVWATIETREGDYPMVFKAGTRHPYRVADAVSPKNGSAIAAVPDLLAALRDILDNCTNRSLGAIEANRHNAEIARRVIARVERAEERP
jgi:hypothetical protein